MTPAMDSNPYRAYSRATHTVAKTRQIVMLYDGAIRNMQQAKEAHDAKDIETRFHKLVKSSEILIGLQGCLDFDAGDQAAHILYEFYASLDARITALHRSQDTEEYQPIIDELKEMREVWNGIDNGEADNEPVDSAVVGDGDASQADSSAAAQDPVRLDGNNVTVSA